MNPRTFLNSSLRSSLRCLHTTSSYRQSLSEASIPTPSLFQSTTHIRPPPSSLPRPAESALESFTSSQGQTIETTVTSGTEMGMYKPSSTPFKRKEWTPKSDDDFLPFDYALERKNRYQVEKRRVAEGQSENTEFEEMKEVHFDPAEGRVKGGVLEKVEPKALGGDRLLAVPAGTGKKRGRPRKVVEPEELEMATEEEVEAIVKAKAESVAAAEETSTTATKKGKKKRALPEIPLVPLSRKAAIRAAAETSHSGVKSLRAPPKQLSPEAQVGIRLLHQQHPHLMTPDVIAKEFGISIKDVNKIIAAKWKITPKAMERKKLAWFRRGEEMKQILGYKH